MGCFLSLSSVLGGWGFGEILYFWGSVVVFGSWLLGRYVLGFNFGRGI